MTGNPDCFVHMWEAGRKADGMSCVINSTGGVIVSSRFARRAKVYGVASRWRDSAMSSYIWVIGTQRHVPGGKRALMMSILKFSRKKIRSRDNRATAAATSAPESCESS